MRQPRPTPLLALLVCLAAAAAPGTAGETPRCPPGTRIGAIRIERVNVFDTAIPEENTPLFRLVNALHRPMLTRASTIRSLLTIHEGEPCRSDRLEEAERTLRAQRFVQDAWVRVERRDQEVVDVLVRVQDAWSTRLRLSFSSQGGANRSTFRILENNLLGTGSRLSWERQSDEDRVERTFSYENPALGSSHWRLVLEDSDNSDGYARLVQLERPFWRLDERRSFAMLAFENRREEKVYDCPGGGAGPCPRVVEVDRWAADRRGGLVGFGWSPRGLVGDRLWRLFGGLRHEQVRWTPVGNGGLALRPDLAPRDARQTFLTLEARWERIDFRRVSFFNTARRIEDLDVGDRFNAGAWIANSLWSDDEALTLFVRGRRTVAFGPRSFLFLGAGWSGRWLRGDSYARVGELELGYLVKPAPLQALFGRLVVSIGDELEGPFRFVIGGGKGARAYASRSFAGSRRLVLNLEHRFFAPWYILRLVRVGLVGFVEAAGAWDAGDPVSWNTLHAGVGVGLRFQIIRSADGTTIHLNAAWPVGPDAGEGNEGVRFSVLTATTF
ncbi:MAG: hypothetical protein D6738_09205 [Acidobacteria bacterium]|nr:MAG: hypothetical protein D6738_09205 [Acidobacteriota bacterium]